MMAAGLVELGCGAVGAQPGGALHPTRPLPPRETRWNRMYVAYCLKGQSHEKFVLRFFHPTAPPGPIRDVLRSF